MHSLSGSATSWRLITTITSQRGHLKQPHNFPSNFGRNLFMAPVPKVPWHISTTKRRFGFPKVDTDLCVCPLRQKKDHKIHTIIITIIKSAAAISPESARGIWICFVPLFRFSVLFHSIPFSTALFRSCGSVVHNNWLSAGLDHVYPQITQLGAPNWHNWHKSKSDTQIAIIKGMGWAELK